MRIRHAFAVTTVTAGLLLLMPSAANAAPASAGSFGQHVRTCAQDMGFSGTHNPGMHRGAAGWDGAACG